MKKKLIITATLLLFSGMVRAQLGVQAGMTLADMKYKTDLVSFNTNFKPGFLLGVTYDLPLANQAVMNFAANYKGAGTKIKDDSGNKISQRLNYLNFDITYNYFFSFKDWDLILEAGGYMAFALSGTQKIKYASGEESSENINIGSTDNDDIKPLDIGGTIGLGAYVNKYKFGLGYQHGFLNLSPDSDLKVKNKGWYIRAAYFFKK